MKTCRQCGVPKEPLAFSTSTVNLDRLDVYCKACRANRARVYRANNLEKSRETYRRHNVKRYHGITAEEYDGLRAQAKACSICGYEERLVLDHNHSTGVKREFLCHHCNTALGLLNEDPERMERMIAYVRKHERRIR